MGQFSPNVAEPLNRAVFVFPAEHKQNLFLIF